MNKNLFKPMNADVTCMLSDRLYLFTKFPSLKCSDYIRYTTGTIITNPEQLRLCSILLGCKQTCAPIFLKIPVDISKFWWTIVHSWIALTT